MFGLDTISWTRFVLVFLSHNPKILENIQFQS